MKRFWFILMAFTVFSLAALWAGEDGLSGRDIVDRGSAATFSGTLLEESGEWYLKTAARTYAVHLGNYEILYPNGINLVSGAQAEVRGFVDGEDISAIRIKTGGKDYAFRKEDGSPLWAGQGRRRNAVQSEAVVRAPSASI